MATPDTAVNEAAAAAAVRPEVEHGAHVASPPASRFDYLFRDLADDAGRFPDAHLSAGDVEAVRQRLQALGAEMATPPGGDEDSANPLIYTYWGQFVDHDLTLNTDGNIGRSDITKTPFEVLTPDEVRGQIGNGRQPQLNLDSVYGTGSVRVPNGSRMLLGEVALASTDPANPLRGVRIPPVHDLARDLPRDAAGKARICDGRNDENLAVAQLHVAVLRFHNAAARWVRENEPEHKDVDAIFRRARRLTQLTYQWVTVNDWLRTITAPGMVESVLTTPKLDVKDAKGLFMPLEFSAAAFRFGHSMIRAEYDFNRNFGHGNLAGFGPSATLDLLFTFTGRAHPPFFGATPVLPFNWVIEWDRWIDAGSPFPNRAARKIDTHVSPPLQALLNEGTDPTLPQGIVALLKSLPERNLLRGYQLALPTGQAVAGALGVAPLTPAQLLQDSSGAMTTALLDGGFTERTPLWFYVLKEAEVQRNGNALGEIGSRIAAETILGHLRHDPDSFISRKWTPEDGVSVCGRPVKTIPDFLRFAGVL